VRPELRARLQRLLYRAEEVARDARTIRSGDPMAARFAEFGAGAMVDWPQVALINPGSIAVGRNVHIRSGVCLEALAPAGTVIIRFGDDVQVGYGVRMVAVNGIEVAPEVAIGHGATLADTIHDWKNVGEEGIRWQAPLKTGRPMRIERGAWIGNNTVATGGITIGAHAIVAPNSVLSRSVPADSIVAGNPAQLQRVRLPDGTWKWLVDPDSLDLEAQAAAERQG